MAVAQKQTQYDKGYDKLKWGSTIAEVEQILGTTLEIDEDESDDNPHTLTRVRKETINGNEVGWSYGFFDNKLYVVQKNISEQNDDVKDEFVNEMGKSLNKEFGKEPTIKTVLISPTDNGHYGYQYTWKNKSVGVILRDGIPPVPGVGWAMGLYTGIAFTSIPILRLGSKLTEEKKAQEKEEAKQKARKLIK